MRYIRVTGWPPSGEDDNFVGPPFISVVAEADLTIPLEDFPAHMVTETNGVLFVTHDIFEHDGELLSAVIEAGKRADPIEMQQAIAYHYNGLMLAHTTHVLVNPGPTPLSVWRTSEMLRQLAHHPNYRGQRVECFIWQGDVPDEMTVVSMKDGTITEEKKR
jgi:hypothetical protein